jgi:hypothetical protein
MRERKAAEDYYYCLLGETSEMCCSDMEASGCPLKCVYLSARRHSNFPIHCCENVKFCIQLGTEPSVRCVVQSDFTA